MDLLQFLGTMGQNPVPVIAAFFIGLMTAISPCPLATNITAIAFISKKIDNSRHTLLAGFVYTLGRMAAYIAVASVIVFFGMNIRFIALGLQHYGELLLGPFLVLCGIYLLDIIPLRPGARRGLVLRVHVRYFRQTGRQGISGCVPARRDLCALVLPVLCRALLRHAHPACSRQRVIR